MTDRGKLAKKQMEIKTLQYLPFTLFWGTLSSHSSPKTGRVCVLHTINVVTGLTRDLLFRAKNFFNASNSPRIAFLDCTTDFFGT